MTTLVPSFSNGFSSFLQVTRTIIKAWMSFVKILSLTTEQAALEHLEKTMNNNNHSSAFIYDWIFFILAGYKYNHKVSGAIEILDD